MNERKKRRIVEATESKDGRQNGGKQADREREKEKLNGKIEHENLPSN